MDTGNLKSKTAKGLFWGGINNGIQQIINLTIGIILARLLNADDYGMIGMLAIFIAISSTIADCGFTNALINKKNTTHKEYNAVFWFNGFVGILLYLLLYLTAPLISKFYGNSDLTNLSRFIFICVFLGGFNLVHNAILLKELKIKEKALIDSISLIIAGSVGVATAFAGLAYWALALQTVIFSFLSTVLRWYFIKWRPTFHFDFTPIREMFWFSSKIFITNIFQYFSYNLFSVILGRFYNERQVGLYSQGQKWMSMGQTFIGGTIQNIAQPVLVQVTEDKVRQKNVFRKILRFGAFVSFPLMLGLAFVGKEFIVITIGEKWIEAVPFLQLFCIWGAFAYIWTLCTNLLLAHGKSDQYMYGMIITSILQLIIVLAVFKYGIFTMVICYLSIYFITLGGWLYLINKLVEIKWVEILKDTLPFLLITLFALFITWILTKHFSNNYLLFFSKVCLTALIYTLIIWKSNAVVFKESVQYFIKRKN